MKFYIGISGKMGTGKSTLTNGIIRDSKVKTTVVSIAQPIKDVQDNIYKQLDLTMKGEKDRDLLIALGMWGRDKDPDFWLKQAAKLMNESDAELIICDDVRFENEAKWFEENGVLLRLTGEQRGDNVDHNTSNVSETALDSYPFEYIIDNRNGIESTLSDAQHCIIKYMNRRYNGKERK